MLGLENVVRMANIHPVKTAALATVSVAVSAYAGIFSGSAARNGFDPQDLVVYAVTGLIVMSYTAIDLGSVLSTRLKYREVGEYIQREGFGNIVQDSKQIGYAKRYANENDMAFELELALGK